MQPTKSITKYDSQTKQSVGFQKLTADEWVNTINKAVNTSRQNNIENSSPILYNNVESESDINDQVQRRGILEGIGEQTRLYEESKPQQIREYTRAEYEQWEKSIKPIEESKLTNTQQQIKNETKRRYNKDIVFFDGTNSEGYSGGASYSNPNRINIDVKQAETFGTNKMVYHEILESDILNNKELYKDNLKIISYQNLVENYNYGLSEMSSASIISYQNLVENYNSNRN